MFDTVSVQDLLAACGFAVTFGIGLIAGLLS